MIFEEAMAEIEKLKWRQTTIRADLSREKKLRKAFHDEIVRLEAERTKLIEALRKIQEWARVAFYPGPNENPDFQSGYTAAVHEAERIVTDKLDAVLAEIGESK